MIWRLVVLLHVLLLGAGSSSRGGRTVTFHRPQQDDSQDRGRTRRETRPFHGPPFTSCRTPLTPVEHKVLDDNTHETGFNGDDGSYVILTWVGDGTGVVLVLSTFSAPIDSFIEGGSSRLYRSTDYAKSFHDISHRINNTFIREEFGVSVGPGGSVILTADIPVVDNRGGIIFTSTDAGATFKFIQLPFHLAQPITYHFLNPDYLVALSIDGGLWLSLDFGAKWTKVHDGVHSFSWGAGINLFFSRSRTDAVEAEERGDLLLKRTTDLGKTFTTIHEDIFSFGYIGAFLFFSVMEDPRSPRVMYFSSDQGDTFSRALLPSASTEQFYSILDGDVDMLFMHVDNPGDTFFGTMYTSDDRGILFSKSLERHLFDGQRKSDFTNITFSTDEGQCWKSYNFTEQPFFFAGLASEPGTKAMNVSVWGFRPEEDGQPMWVAVTIDFQSLITRE
ncbi:Sortilin [Liparis tanakae]|uniref:Sortilin n=1 Tax=Liparis tanakae TaxID=230148 RepID=A0A4Z2H0P6_9TELE|nr:Sortilin [Liparis tanakae]